MNTPLPQLPPSTPATKRGIHRTGIEWTDYAVGSPFLFVDRRDGKVLPNACVKASAGCANCYAEAIGLRFKNGLPYTKASMEHLDVRIDERVIQSMLTFKPRPVYRSPDGRPKVFLGDMTDVFGEWVPFVLLDKVFAAMALRPYVDWQILTKRPERMAEYLNTPGRLGHIWAAASALDPRLEDEEADVPYASKLCNVWLGTSVENQKTADERIPHLLKCPAAVRFLSCEPLIGPVDLSAFFGGGAWAIAGGESGRGARACDVNWIRSIVKQCKAASVPCFVKQLGTRVVCRNDKVSDWLDECHLSLDHIDTEGVTMQGDPVRVMLRDRKGGDPGEWPEDLRVREFPRRVEIANA